ncbi:tail fiber assembly protein [Xenorhabdus sp. SF857]|uniref:tail fiber assembly protein n=1 Tax=Xenorhabdus bakwenae TaxID=3026967 RepID=UPI0025580957|nr:tail fiber assembly protein [Xenorhabdus sp. SF857]WFQ79433.1 tail fiber assembly protein [Xenorhabdus sp. SF857]
MYVYSAKFNAFHPIEWQQDYINAGTWPDDGIEVSEAVYLKFLTPPQGKMRIAGTDGLPAWGDIPPPTPAESRQQAEQEKLYRLSQAAKSIAPLQYAVDLQMETDSERAALTEWKRYCVLLNRVDCSTAPNIDWPKAPE